MGELVKARLLRAELAVGSTEESAETDSKSRVRLSPEELASRVDDLRVLMFDLRLELAALSWNLRSIRSTRKSSVDLLETVLSTSEIDALIARGSRIYSRAGAAPMLKGLIDNSSDELQASSVRSCFDHCRSLFHFADRLPEGAEERRIVAAGLCRRALHRSSLNVVEALQIAEEHFATKIGTRPLPPIPP